MTPPLMLSEQVALGRGYSVQFRLADGRMDVMWEPRMPMGRRGRQLLPAYREARNAFLRDVAKAAGTNVLVAEV